MLWSEFRSQIPELAEQARKLFGRNMLALIGTIRSDGSPRISPVEVFFTPDELLVGMMRQSKKAFDLMRNPRCVVHNTISDPNGSQPELKLYCRSILGDDHTRSRYCKAYTERWKRKPPHSFPAYVFSMDVDSAALIRYDTQKNQMIVKSWSSKSGLKERTRKYP
jgi:hypothetical protein